MENQSFIVILLAVLQLFILNKKRRNSWKIILWEKDNFEIALKQKRRFLTN